VARGVCRVHRSAVLKAVFVGLCRAEVTREKKLSSGKHLPQILLQGLF